MYRKLLATTALTLVMTGGAYAQDNANLQAPSDDATIVTEDNMSEDQSMAQDQGMAQDQSMEGDGEELASASQSGVSGDGWLASELMGETIYTGPSDDAESIGNVNDFVLDQNGEIAAVVVGVGGFLGIGQKAVAINWDDIEPTAGPDGVQRLTSSMTRDQLDAAAPFDRSEWLASESMQQQNGDVLVDDNADMTSEDEGMAPATGDAGMAAESDMAAEDGMSGETDIIAEDGGMAADNGGMAADNGGMAAETGEDTMGAGAADPTVDSTMDQQMQPVSASEISVEDLTGTAVYGAEDEQIGSIGDIILSQDGGVEAVIVDFGGFLGIGTKPVAISYQNLEFFTDASDSLILRTDLTTEDMEAAPEYDEETYADAPNDQLVTFE